MVYLIVSNIVLLVINLILFVHDFIVNKDLEKTKEKIDNFFLKNNLTNFATNLKIRDDLIKSDFKGKVKNKKLLEELFNDNANLWVSLSGNYYGNYKFITKQIVDYKFHNIEYLLNRLQEFEKKQEILDEYENKEKKEK